MKVHGVDTIRGWLGWCPSEPAWTHRVVSEQDDGTGTPAGSGSFRERAFRWLGLFRNQMLLLAIWFSVIGYLLLITIGDNNVMLFIWGLLAGLGLSAFMGFRFWGTMNEVLENGAVFLATLYDKTTISLAVLVFLIPLVISISASPAANMMMWNAVTAGFIFMLFWTQLFVVWFWETRIHRKLHSDGLMLTMAGGGTDYAHT
jgi:hypothetical protein